MADHEYATGQPSKVAGVDGQLYEPIVSQSVPHEIHQKMLKLVEERHLVAGQRLPPERELSTSFRVSRTSLRDALRSLAEHGIVESRRGAGWYIVSDDISLVRRASQRYESSDVALQQMVEARLTLEPEIAALAAARRTDEEIILLDRAVRQLERTTDTRQYIRLDVELHLLIGNCSRNGYLSLALRSVIERMEESRRDLRPVLPTAPSIAEHERIVGAIQKGDASAARSAMRRHLANFQRRTVALFNEDGIATEPSSQR